MKILRNERGFAMGFVLILAVVALGLTLAMLYMVGTGSSVSGHQKRYHTAVEAGRGGVEATLQLIGSRGVPFTTDNSILSLSVTGGVTNLQTKLEKTTGAWGALLDNSMTIDANDPATYDVRLTLGGYRAYGKVVDTVVGNSGPDEGLLKSGVVSSNSGEVMVMSLPYLYTVEVMAQSTANPTERSKISVLYQY